MFLGYSNKSKAYKCLNLKTHKIIESLHVRIDEFSKNIEEQSIKEPKDYRNFIYYENKAIPKPHDGEGKQEENESPKSPKTPEHPKLQVDPTESQSRFTESQFRSVELHFGDT